MSKESAIIIEKVSYGMTIGDLKFGNVRPGVVEATLKPGSTLEDALDELDERLTAWHKKRYPHLYQDGVGSVSQWDANYVPPPSTITTVGIGGPLVIDLRKEKIEIAIENASTIDELKEVKTTYPLMPVTVNDMYKRKMEDLLSGRPKDFTENID